MLPRTHTLVFLFTHFHGAGPGVDARLAHAAQRAGWIPVSAAAWSPPALVTPPWSCAATRS